MIRTRLFDLIKRELVGKYAFTNNNIKFKIEGIIYGYKDIADNLSEYWVRELKKINFDYKIGGIALFGTDAEGKAQNVTIAEHKILEFTIIEDKTT